MPGGQKKKPQNQSSSQSNDVPNFDFLKNEPTDSANNSVVPASSGQDSQGKGKSFDFSEIKNALGSEQVQGMFMDAIEKRLQTMVGKSSGFFTSLPKSVQQRVLALHNIHSQKVELDKQFEAEVKELEKKYALKFDPIYTKRTNIISGAIEADPQDIEEGKQKRKEMLGNVIDEEEVEKEAKDEKEEEEDKNIKGIPEFWLTCLRHCDSTAELIEEKDEDALRYLENIKWKNLEEGKDSFVLQFFFAKNPYFNNAILEKTYHLMEDAEFGEVMYDRCEATPIEWKQGKNLTVKKVTKKQKPKANRGKRGGGYAKGARDNQGKTITVEEKVPSFFHFFSDPETMIDMYLSMVGDQDQNAPDPEVILENDYEVGLELKEKVVPNAVIYYTGMTGLKEDEEDEFDEEGEEDESYHSSQDDDYEPKDARLSKVIRGKNAPAPRGGQECNQQ